MDSPETWRWIWLAAAVLLILGEIAVAGTFFLLPFGLAALVACILAFAGVGLVAQWVAFVAVAAVASLALVPLRRRLDRSPAQDGIGARRLLNQEAVVIVEIEPGPHGSGFVRLGREEWRAESLHRSGLPVGAVVRVSEVRGTGVVVEAVDAAGRFDPERGAQ